MKNIAVLLVVVVIAGIVSSAVASKDPQFLDFIAKYNKQYSSDVELVLRYEIFQENLRKIEQHNKVSSFQLGITEFADLSLSEYVKAKLSTQTVHDPSLELTLPPAAELETAAPPTSVDWRAHTAPVVVGPVRTSGDCGDAVVVSIIDSISSDYAVSSNDDVYNFDPKYVLDCDGLGCTGQDISKVWSFIAKYGLNWYYNGCPTGPGLGLCISGYNCTKSGSEADLADAVARLGPIPILIDASHSSFQLYAKGIYYEPACSPSLPNHALLLVGYGSLNGQDYWIARNSWGKAWGQDGDILLARNRNNNCGVAASACYARTVHTCVC